MTDWYEAELSSEDLEDLREAKRKLEYPKLAARLTDLIGSPIEAGIRRLPADWNKRIGKATESALLTGLEFSIKTMGRPESRRSQDWLHKLLIVGTGAAGGAIGLVALPVELPVSTCVILRSVADIARAEGHDISSMEVRVECLEVFAFGGKSSRDDGAETGYWVVRAAMAREVTDAAEYLANKGLIDKGVPVIAKLIGKIAPTFASLVTQQAAAMVAPVLGGVAGGTINYLFIAHFQDMASGHFVIKRLEKKYGPDLVRSTYGGLAV
jgi:hypothetical protein